MDSFHKKFHLQKCRVQTKTSARIEAEADPRTMYSMFSFVKAFCENLASELIFNWDATQFIMSDDLDTKGLYISTEKARDQVLTSDGTGTVGFASNYFIYIMRQGIVRCQFLFF